MTPANEASHYKIHLETLSTDEDTSSQPVLKATEAEAKTVKSTREKPKVAPWIHFVAGGVGGMAGSILTCPFDVVKTRLQSDLYHSPISSHTKSKNPIVAAARHMAETFSIMKTVYKVEGARSLFKGLGPNLVGVIPSRSINFFTYGLGKDIISRKLNNGNEATWVHLLAAANAGIVTSTFTNPIWLVKTRLQLDRASRSSGQRQYKNSWDCIKQVVRNEGIRGLYSGLTASYLGVTESSIQWVLYEQMKGLIRKQEAHRASRGFEPTSTDKFLSWAASSGAAGAAKFMASLLTYPHEVVRTRLRQAPMQNGQPKYRGLISCFRIIIKEEGFLSMYGGLTPHLMRTVPNSIIMFGTWELVVRLLSGRAT